MRRAVRLAAYMILFVLAVMTGMLVPLVWIAHF